jgi:hypothetical protein
MTSETIGVVPSALCSGASALNQARRTRFSICTKKRSLASGMLSLRYFVLSAPLSYTLRNFTPLARPLKF